MRSRLAIVGILLLAVCLPATANQLTFQFTGNFSHDNDVQLFAVTLAVPEALSAWTTSGATGGFPTYLAMFDGTGLGMTQQSGDPTCLNGFSSYNSHGLCNDAMVFEPPVGVIPAGTYYIALTQWDNGMVNNVPTGSSTSTSSTTRTSPRPTAPARATSAIRLPACMTPRIGPSRFS